MSNEHNETPLSGNGHNGHTPTGPVESGPEPNWTRYSSLALLAAAIGWGIFFGVGVLRAALGQAEHDSFSQFFASFHTGFITWLCVPVGSMALLMIFQLSLGRWGYVMRRALEASTRCYPLMVVLFIPVAVGLFVTDNHSIFWWANAPVQEPGAAGEWAAANQHAWQDLQLKRNYLEPTFALVRAGIILAIWGAMIYLLNSWSAKVNKENFTVYREKFKMLSGPGLMIYAVSMMVFVTDWVMSLEPGWASTMFPIIFGITQILAAYAFALAVILLMARGPQKGELSNLDQINLGSFLLAFTLFWTYISFSQFLLIWVGNLPEEQPFMLKRMVAGWEWMMVILFVFHFALPFILLLYRDVKTSNTWLFRVAVGLVMVCAFDAFIWIEPTFSRENQPLFWLMDIGSLIGIGGLYVFCFIRQYKGRWHLPGYEDHLYHREHVHHG